MGSRDHTGLTGSPPAVSGRIAGAVLAAIRAHVGLTQQALAETMGVSRDAVQGWESGRRPLINLKRTQLGKLDRLLRSATAESAYLHVLDKAVEADLILADVTEPDLGQHPFATVVPNRLLTDLLAWPLSGRPPRQLAPLRARLDLGAAERDELAAALRAVADRAGRDQTGAMLRRQVHYLVAEHGGSAEWLRADMATDIRAMPTLHEWTPDWAVTRSRAISAAARGDHEPLHRFVHEGLATDQTTLANLTYWAYWVGEIPHQWGQDSDMLTDGQPWSGELLLASLLDGIESAPYAELCAHALHALLRTRRNLADHPAHRIRLGQVLDQTTSTDRLTPDARRKLDQIAYAIGR